MLKDSSEIQEAAKMLDDLLNQSAVVAPAAPFFKARPGLPAKNRQPPETRPKPSPAPSPDMEMDDTDLVYRGDRLENTLFAMCKRGGFQGAALVDSNGLPLAVYNSPVDEDTIAAAATVLGAALDKAGSLLKQADANYISMDINYIDKAVIRRFAINQQIYFLLAVCPQEVDEKTEFELSIEKVTSILKKK